MKQVVEQVQQRLFALRDGAFLQRLGVDEDLSGRLKNFDDVAQVHTAEAFEERSNDGTLEDFMLEQKNALLDLARATSRECPHILNDVAKVMAPAIESEFAGYEIAGVDNEPQGFGPSLYVSITNWIFMSLAQEDYLKEAADQKPVGVYHDLMTVLELGHFPCGWEQLPTRGRLWVY